MSIRARWLLTSPTRVGGGPVEHDRDGGAAVGGLLEEVPRHLVGVARGRGHEQPEVGRREQLGGERAVALLDRVDVGGVEQGEPLRDRGRGDQLERAGVAGGARRAFEVGQDPARVEPVGVGRVVHQHRRARGRPEHARLADPLAHQRVHQRRLARARRAADDRRAAARRSAPAGAARSRRAGRPSPTWLHGPARRPGRRTAAGRS